MKWKGKIDFERPITLNGKPHGVDRVPALPTWQATDEGRLVYDETTDSLYLGMSVGTDGSTGAGWDDLGSSGIAPHDHNTLYYTKTQTDNFFDGEDAGYKQVNWLRITNKPADFTPSVHDNTAHSETYIEASGVTFENLQANGDVGNGSDQVAQGDHNHDSIYYRQSELQTSGQSSVHWDNITNAPSFGTPNWQDPVATSGDLPATADLMDARLVQDDGDGKPAHYVYNGSNWVKIADVDWGDGGSIGFVSTTSLTSSNVSAAINETQTNVAGVQSNLTTHEGQPNPHGINLDKAYEASSMITVDVADVDWMLGTGRDFRIYDSTDPNKFVVTEGSGVSISTNGNVDLTAAEFNFNDNRLASAITLTDVSNTGLPGGSISIVGGIVAAYNNLPSHNHDTMYYTESEVDSLLSGKSDTGHSHDDLYYTETELSSSNAGTVSVHWDNLTSIPTTFAPATHDNTAHSAAYIVATDVTFENLNTNGDVGTGADQVAAGDHNHDSQYAAIIHTHNDQYYTETEIDSMLSTKSDTTHTHTESNITDLDKYTTTEVDNLLAGKADSVHTHTESQITDLDKYTTTEVDNLLSGKSDTTHTHTESDITDLDKYTTTEVDTKFNELLIPSTSGAPSDSPAANTVRFDASTNILYIYNGTSWVSTTLS